MEILQWTKEELRQMTMVELLEAVGSVALRLADLTTVPPPVVQSQSPDL